MCENEPIPVYEAWNSRQAHFVCQMLANAGIEARVASEAIEAVSGRIPYQVATCPVWVHKADFQRASEVLQEYETWLHERRHEAPDTPEPFCYHCGETVEMTQSPCPNCGNSLDWSDVQ